jgi:NADH:ubiquinone oxidoreductase subunit D
MGSKGIRELGIVGTAAAIANAVHHATGIRVRDFLDLELPARATWIRMMMVELDRIRGAQVDPVLGSHTFRHGHVYGSFGLWGCTHAGALRRFRY